MSEQPDPADCNSIPEVPAAGVRRRSARRREHGTVRADTEACHRYRTSRRQNDGNVTAYRLLHLLVRGLRLRPDWPRHRPGHSECTGSLSLRHG